MSDTVPSSLDGGTIYPYSSKLPKYVREAVETVVESGDAGVRDGNVHLDLSDFSEKAVDLFRDFTVGFCGELIDRLDDARKDSHVVVDEFDDSVPKVSLNNIGTEHSKDIVRIEAQVQDLAKPTVHNLTAKWECQNSHTTTKRYHRWVDVLETPVQCGEDGCLDRPTDRIANVGTQIDVQQLVLSETNKDDRNSRNLIAEIDEPLIGEFDRRDTVEVLAQVQIADRANESKVEPYLHIFGFKPVGHTIDLTSQRVNELISLADKSDDIIDELVDSVAPEIVDKCGQREAKLAGLCSIVKGANHTDRNMIHSLFYGKRGSGKSKIMESLQEIAENSQFADAQNASSAGLTATVSQTSKLQGEGEQWVITAGTLPQAHEGVAFVDELDKVENRVQEVLATPMSSGRVIIKKAGEAKLTAETSIVSAANPEDQTYDGGEPIDSLDIPVHIQNRFDLILRVDDEVKEEAEEREIMRKVAKRKQGQYDSPMDKNTLRDYVALAKRQEVEMTSKAQEEIIDRILELRMDFTESNLASIEMSGREQEKLTRLSSAMAKLRLANKVREQDVARAWNLMLHGLQSVTFDALNLQKVPVSQSGQK
jgi:DNA replicative helicase MCM subunit Mcm2 (Cdc46/Mcm family)